KRKQKLIGAIAKTPALAVHKQLHFLSCADHLYIFFCMFRIIPMPDNMQSLGIRINPSIPHHLMGIVRIFRNAHSVYLATSAVVFFSSIMGVGIREDNIHASRTYPTSCTWADLPVFPPPANRFQGMLILVPIVIAGIVTFIQRSFPLLMERVGIFVPIFTQSFIAHVFGGNHRMFCALIDIEHFTPVFRQLTIQHFTGSDGASTMRIILVPNSDHFRHMLFGDGFISTFPKQDTWTIPVINDRIAHQLCPLLPPTAFYISFC